MKVLLVERIRNIISATHKEQHAIVDIVELREFGAAFAEQFGIEYPLLSDAGSEFIRELGILNTLIDPDESVYDRS